MPHSSVRVAALDGLPELVRAAGHDFSRWLGVQGIDPGLLAEPDDRIDFALMARLLDGAAALTGDDCVGLHLGAAQSIHIAGVLGYVVQYAPDVRTQLDHVVRYMALHQDGAQVRCDEADGVATLSYAVLDRHVMLHRHDAEATVALWLNQTRALTGLGEWAPSSVHFEHAAPQPASERALRRFFGCTVLFCEPFTGARFPTAFLDTPVRSADRGLANILMRHANDMLAHHPDTTSVTARARRLIAAGLANGHAGIDEVATRIGMTPRTLQRRLADEGLQFSELTDATRRDLATRYLRDARISLTDAAFLVGYSDLTAFHRAFRRWFGMTPAAYQRQLQNGDRLSS